MIAVLTGATGGIGAEILRGLVAAGADVVIGCRDLVRGTAVASALPGSDRVRVQPLDLASLASVRAFVAWAERELSAVDVLVNAAGVWSRQRRQTSDGFEVTFGVNHIAHHALTVGLLPLISRSRRARVVTVASGIHVRGALAWDDLMQANVRGYNGVRAYEQSKLANVMFASALARHARGIASNAVHPGVVRTNLTREYPEMFRATPARSFVTPAIAARSVLHLALDATNVTGRYFDRDRELSPSKAAQVVDDQERLWRTTESLIAGVR